MFVGGCPRAGTTLLQNMLDSHPDIAGGPEFDHLPRIVELRALLQAGQTSGRLAAFELDVDSSVSALVADLLDHYRKRRGTRLLSEKTPENALHFAELLELFPAARAIFVIRDPRAVAASMLAVGARASRRSAPTPPYTRSVVQAIDTIAEYNDAGLGLSPHERLYTVRYESLVETPADTTRALCGFLGLEWDKAMLRPSAIAHDGSTVLDDVWYTQSMYQSDPDPARVETWRQRLGRRRQGLVESAFRLDTRLTHEWGYDLGSPTRIQRLLRADHWSLVVIRRTAFIMRQVRKGRDSLRPGAASRSRT